jgi:hypothetical protein
MGNQKFIEILYGHAKDIKNNSQRFEFKIITNQYVIQLFSEA